MRSNCNSSMTSSRLSDTSDPHKMRMPLALELYKTPKRESLQQAAGGPEPMAAPHSRVRNMPQLPQGLAPCAGLGDGPAVSFSPSRFLSFSCSQTMQSNGSGVPVSYGGIA